MKPAFTGIGFMAGYGGRAARTAVFLVSGLSVTGLATAAEPSVHPYLTDRWSFQLGIYYPDVSTEVRLDNRTTGRGTKVDFEDDLDLTDRDTLGSVLGSVRLGDKWRIEAEYFALNRDGTRTIDRDIDWGDTTYPINSRVSSSFDSNIYRLSGGYSFVKDDTQELGVAFGLFVTDFEATLETANLGSSAADTLAPLPTLGAYGAYAFTPQWLLSGRVDYFSLGYEDYDGSLLNFQAQIDYRFTRHLGVGLSYRYVDYDLSVMKNSWDGSISYSFSGPSLAAVASF